MFKFSKVSTPQSPSLAHEMYERYGKRAVTLRQNLETRKDTKPESFLGALVPEYRKIFEPVMNKTQNVAYRGLEFDVHDYGDYIRFRPKNRNGKCPTRARVFFHGLRQDKMKFFPDAYNAGEKASYDKFYRAALRTIDSQNALSGIEDEPMDVIWHRGFWGEPDDRNLIAHQYVNENVNPHFRRSFIDHNIYKFARQDMEKQFGEGVFAPDIFAKSAAFTLDKLQKKYKNIDIVTHSMGNATFLEALDILDKAPSDAEGAKQNKAKISALLTHPVPSANHAAAGAKTELQRQKSYSELLKYTVDILEKLLGRDKKKKTYFDVPAPVKILSLLNKSVHDGKMTEAQREIIIKGVEKNDIDIVKGHYHFDALNNALKQAFPLLDKRLLRPKMTSFRKWPLPYIDDYIVSGITDKEQENSRTSMMIALQPFCVSPFYNGKAENLLNKQLGEGRWKVFSAGQDKLAPEPEKFLSNIFDFNNQKPALTLEKHAVQKEDLKKIQDQKMVIVQSGGHSTPVLQNNALHNLVTRMNN